MADQPKYRDTLRRILSQSGLIGFERFDGTLALSTLDNNGAAVYTIDNGDVKLDGKGVPVVGYGFTETDKMITSIQVKYQKILPLQNEWGATKYINRNATEHNFTLTDSYGTAAYYGYLLQLAYETLGEERPLTVEADCIRDADTAERLARLMILYRYKPQAVVNVECIYTGLQLEVGDEVGLNISFLPSYFNGLSYMVSGVRIIPNVGAEAGVKITLIEKGSKNTPAVTELLDTFSTGDLLQDKLDNVSGSNYTEVL